MLIADINHYEVILSKLWMNKNEILLNTQNDVIVFSHYSMLWTLMTQAEMHWTTYSDVHQSSDFEDFHEKQTVELMTSQLSEHFIEVQLSDHL